MMSVVFALCGATGVYLVYSAASGGTRTGRPAGRSVRAHVVGLPLVAHDHLGTMLRRAGLETVSPWQFAGTMLFVGGSALALGTTVFGPGIPAVLLGVAAASAPVAAWRHRRQAARRAAQECWPRLIEELRVFTGAAGRPIPQALLEVGLRGPVELRPAFEAAQREWSLSTDFARTVAVLKDRLADPTADATCETLLVAHEVGGEIDRRLQSLAEDRRADVRDRKESDAKQAGARFARWFVLIVPAGMGLAGLNVGDGRSAYQGAVGQVLVAGAVAMVVACWWWAGRIMQVPDAERVFTE